MVDISNPSDELLEALLEIFQDAWHAGKKPDPEAFCKEHPEGGDALRALIENFLAVAGRLPELGSDALLDADQTGDQEESTEDPTLPHQRLGDFRLLREIGRGGMGVVYEADQISLKRKVALKVLPTHLSFSQDAVMKFRREAEAGGRQRHPGIVAVYAVGEEEGSHFIAQELVEGSFTLADRLENYRKDSTLPLGYFREITRIIVQVAEALQHAHEAGVIHRDVKPSNILLTRENLPKVTDFGLAKVVDALALSRTGELAGTPYYMSPEQVSSRRGEIDHRTDIFSLGVTLYEMLTLARPFEGETSQEILKKIINAEPRDPRRLNPRIPRDLAMVCLKALEKDRRRRYPSMEAFAEDLRRYLQGEVVLAKPSGPATRLWKRVKRNPALSSAMGVAALALLVLIASIPWYILRITDERDKADKERTAALEAKEEAEDQRQAALAAKDTAELETKKVTAINSFLENMLSSPDPAKDGRDVRVAEILAQAVARIDEDFPAQPEIAATLQNTIGRTYIGLGLYKEAEPLLKTALETLQGRLGEEHPKTLVFMKHMGFIIYKLGRFSEARAVLEKTLETQRRILGDEHPDTLETMNNLAIVLCDLTRFSETEKLLQNIIEQDQLLRGSENEATLGFVHNLARLYYLMGRYTECEPLQAQVLKGRRRIQGDKHPDTIRSMINLAATLEKLNRIEEAKSILTNALDASRSILGEEHPDTLKALKTHADIFSKQGKYDEAGSILTKALETCKRVQGEAHPATLSFKDKLGLLYRKQGKFEQGLNLHHDVLETRCRVLGEKHPDTLDSLQVIADTFIDQGRYSEAELQCRNLVDQRFQVQGEEHRDTIRAKRKLANLLLNTGNLAEAESLYTGLIVVAGRVLGERHEETTISMNDLAVVFKRQGKLAEAEALFNNVLEIRRHSLGDMHDFTLSSITNLAQIYQLQERWDDAIPLFREYINHAGKATPSCAKDIPFFQAMLGAALVELDRFEEAEPELLEAFDKLKAAVGEKHIGTQTVAQNLIDLYIAWGKPEKTEKYRTFLKGAGR